LKAPAQVLHQRKSAAFRDVRTRSLEVALPAQRHRPPGDLQSLRHERAYLGNRCNLLGVIRHQLAQRVEHRIEPLVGLHERRDEAVVSRQYETALADFSVLQVRPDSRNPRLHLERMTYPHGLH